MIALHTERTTRAHGTKMDSKVVPTTCHSGTGALFGIRGPLTGIFPFHLSSPLLFEVTNVFVPFENGDQYGWRLKVGVCLAAIESQKNMVLLCLVCSYPRPRFSKAKLSKVRKPLWTNHPLNLELFHNCKFNLFWSVIYFYHSNKWKLKKHIEFGLLDSVLVAFLYVSFILYSVFVVWNYIYLLFCLQNKTFSS